MIFKDKKNKQKFKPEILEAIEKFSENSEYGVSIEEISAIGKNLSKEQKIEYARIFGVKLEE